MVYVSMCFSNNMLLHFYLFINNILKLLEFLSSLKEIYSISYRSRTADVLLSKRRNTLQLAVQMNKKRRLLPSKWSTSVCHILSEEHFKQVKRDKQRLLNGYFLSTPGRTYPDRCPRAEDNKFVLLWSLHNTAGALIGRPHVAGYRILFSSNDIPIVSKSVNARSQWLPLEVCDVLRHEFQSTCYKHWPWAKILRA